MNRNTLLGEPVRAAGRSIEFGGRIMRRLGEQIITADQDAKTQKVLAGFAGHFAVVANFVEEETTRGMTKSVAAAVAGRALQEGIIDQASIVEVRPLMSEDRFCDRVSAGRLQTAATTLTETLTASGVNAVFDTHPFIIPSDDKELDESQSWRVIAEDLDLFRRQVQSEPASTIAVLGITLPSEADQIFGQPVFGKQSGQTRGEMAVLRQVGVNPQNNLLLTPSTRHLHTVSAN